ncbi:6-carboxytetrahydropterin synthase [Candidatus Pacearchaeota archaeon]|nr:6-carboxytetrahydropterin synthase [Candidatus Pacearchaeota archaeon]
MKLIYKTSIDCGHSIPDTPELLTKKCAQQHGHTYNMEFSFDLPSLKRYFKKDFVDFQLVKDMVHEIVDKYDHKMLNEFNIFTVEQLCLIVKAQIVTKLKYQNDAAVGLRVFETAKYGVEC